MESSANQSLPLLEELSPTELRLFYGVACGLDDYELAEIFGIKRETVKVYIRAGLKKIHARNRAQAMTILFRRGILTREMFPEHKH